MMLGGFFTCDATFLKVSRGDRQQIRGAEADHKVPAEWTPRWKSTRQLLPHTQQRILMLRAVDGWLRSDRLLEASHERRLDTCQRRSEILILVHYVYLGFV